MEDGIDKNYSNSTANTQNFHIRFNAEINKLPCPLVLIETKPLTKQKVQRQKHQINKSTKLSKAVLHLQQIAFVFEEIKSVKTVLKKRTMYCRRT